MAARKWLIRSLFPLLLLVGIGVGLWVHAFMNPQYVRQQLVLYLEREFPEYRVEIGSAYLRLFGGISVWDLRMTRKDDPTGQPVVVIPQALLAHDKEAFQNGELVLRKIELTGLRVRLEKRLDGTFNLADLIRTDKKKDGESPTALICRKSSVSYTDHRLSPEVILDLREFDFTVLNDPSTVFAAEVLMPNSPLGPIRLQGRYDINSGDRFANVDFNAVRFGPEATRLLALVNPDAAKQVESLQGSATAHLKISYQSDQPSPWKHDLKLELKECYFKHPELPIELADLSVKARCTNGHLIVERATATSGPAQITLSLDLPIKPANIETALAGEKADRLPMKPWGKPEEKRNPLLLQTMFEHLQPVKEARPTPLAVGIAPESEDGSELWQRLESRLRKLDLAVSHLPLTKDLFARLPPKLQSIQKLLSPEGAVSLNLEFRRDGENWSKRCTIRPEGFTARYEDYPYPVTNMRGQLDQLFCPEAPDLLTVDLTGLAAGKLVTIKGHVRGEDPELDMDLKIAANGLPLDDKELIDALPQPYPALVRQMRASGRGDLSISIKHNAETRRLYGPDEFDNEFYLSIFDGNFNHQNFPYPLERVQGTVYLRTQPIHPTLLPAVPGVPPPQQKAWGGIGYLELRDFAAVHGSSKLKFSGRKEPTTGGAALTIKVDARGLELDQDLYDSMALLKLSDVANVFRPRGRMNCILQARLFQRGEALMSPESTFDPSEDLEVSFAFAGASLQPTFFPYQLDDTMGQLTYNKKRVELFDFSARHGDSQVRIARSEVILRPNGGHWSDVRDLRVAPLVFDEALLGAVSPGLRKAITSLDLKGGLSLHATRLVIDEQEGSSRPRMLPTPEPVPAFARGYSPEFNADSPPYSQRGDSTPNKDAPLPTVYWDGKLVFNNASLNAGVPFENLMGSFATRGLYEGDKFGRVIANLSLESSKVVRQPVQEMVARFEINPKEPNVVKVPMIRGFLYGGEVGGEARLVLRDYPRFDLKLNATRIRLEEIAKQQKLTSKVQLEGLATAQVYLQNPPDEKTGRPMLQGGGSIDVPNGKLLNLPHILDLLKVLKGKPPDETFFEEAKILFRIRGNRVMIGQLDLLGNAISLGGEGEMNLDGTNMSLEFYTVWTRVNNLLAPPLNDVTAVFSKAFFKVFVKGELGGKTEIRKEAVPAVIEPVKRLLDRMKLRPVN